MEGWEKMERNTIRQRQKHHLEVCEWSKTIAPHKAKKDLVEVNIVVVYKMCYSSKE